MQRGSDYNSRVAAAETLTQLASAMATDLRHQTAWILGNLMAAEANRARPGPSSASNQSVAGEQESEDRPGQAVDQGPEEDNANPGAGDHEDSDKENAAPEGGK